MAAFTTNEIIKALECCISTLPSGCRECPLFFETNSKMVCSKILTKLVLDHINRQRAEIERLGIELKAMRGAANSYRMHYDAKEIVGEQG